MELLINDVARILGGTARDWDPTERNRERFYITLPDGVEIFVRGGGYGFEGRIEFDGHYPNYIDERGSKQTVYPRNCGAIKYEAAAPSITVSNKKTAEQIAKDIQRRLLPVLVPVWHKCKAYADRTTEHARILVAARESIAKMSGGKANDYDRVVHFSNGRVKYIRPASGDEPTTIDIELSNVTIAQFQVILGALKTPPEIDITSLTQEADGSSVAFKNETGN
jgi:hypothetical protein